MYFFIGCFVVKGEYLKVILYHSAYCFASFTFFIHNFLYNFYYSECNRRASQLLLFTSTESKESEKTLPLQLGNKVAKSIVWLILCCSFACLGYDQTCTWHTLLHVSAVFQFIPFCFSTIVVFSVIIIKPNHLPPVNHSQTIGYPNTKSKYNCLITFNTQFKTALLCLGT